MTRASGQIDLWEPPGGMSNWEKASGLTFWEGLYLPDGLGMPWGSPGEIGGGGCSGHMETTTYNNSLIFLQHKDTDVLDKQRDTCTEL